MRKRVTVGRSGADVRRGPGMYRKSSPQAEAEAAALIWLRKQGLPAAEVLDVGPDWLITREIAGCTAADPWPEDQRLRVVDSLAEITGDLHALSVRDCPFDRTLAVTVASAREVVAAGRVDLDDLDEERRDWTSGQLLDALNAQQQEMRAREVLSVTHGDWCLPNVVLDPATVRVVGILDTARVGRADRCTDLALMSRSLGSDRLNSQYGSRYARRYLSRCDHSPLEDDKLDFYRLLDEFF